MKLGFVSAIVADLSFEEVVTLAAEENYACVEMLCWPKGKVERRYAGVTHIDVNELDSAGVTKINDFLKAKNVSISALGYYPNPLDADEQQSKYYVEHIKKAISAARMLGLDIFNTFIGRDHTRNVEENFESFKKIWPTIVKYAEEKGVKIGIENCPMHFTDDEWPGGKNLAYSPALWRRMFKVIPSMNFGLNYDPSHLVWQQMDYIKPLYDFKDRIFHVHIKDAKVHPGQLNDVGIMAAPLEYHSPKLPGLGDVDWKRFFSTLADIGYDGPVVVEVEDRDYEGTLESRKKALIQSRDYIKQFVAL